MVKMIAGALIGLFIIIQGIYVWYVYMTTFVEQGNHILFGLSIFQIGIGIYILFRASKSNEQKMKTNEFGFPITPAAQPAGGVLQKNNELVHEYAQTSELRDKLKMIETAAESHEKATKSEGVG
jgi:hypothetical protein